MGPKKKTQKNAFSFFLDEYVQKEWERGRKISHRIGAEECGPLWKETSDEEKQRYSKMAVAHKQSMKNDDSCKLTSYGESYSEVHKRLAIQQKKLESADREISQTISHLDLNRLSHHLFYIIHCNYYCKTDGGVFVPGELAISEFCLNDGIRRTYHELIDPGEIPLGFAYEAHQNIKEVHNLPYPPYSHGSNNFNSILNNIKDFIKPGNMRDDRFPPLYCLEKDINTCESILGNLMNSGEEMPFRVYGLHKMFFVLKNKCAENFHSDDVIGGFPVLSNAMMELEKDVFRYVPGISCSYHATMEEYYQNCSLSIVRRYVYVICDHCCEFLNIAIIPGKHGRLKCDTNRSETVKEIVKNMEELSAATEKTEDHKPQTKRTLSSFFAGKNAPDWSKITSQTIYEELLSEKRAQESEFSYGRGRGRACLSGLMDDDLEYPRISEKTNGDDYPASRR